MTATARFRALSTAFAAALFAILVDSASAQQADPPFKGKTINFYIGFGPGGTYDYYARLIARFIGRYIPGNPTVVAQAMPGAGSLQLANFLFAQAPRDGTAMGTVTQTVALGEALHSPGVRYKAAEFSWIGRATAILEIAILRGSSRVKTIEDATKYEVPVAGTGAGSPSEGYPKLMNALAGTRFRLISGYTSSTRSMLALEAGEVEGAFTSWNTLRWTKQNWLRNNFVNILYQCALARHPDLPNVPTDVELAQTEEGRQVMAFYTSSAAIGRSILAPPGIPAERLNLLRRAFDATIKDPEFLAEIERGQQEFQPASGEELQKLIGDVASAPRGIVERTEAILRGGR
ncbi:MAG TPA: tripartite tricarboxylate transporter substrate-binding protein [Xanthobacteraceae bacterium]|jgi:tripartite-type tricarboxylate transporter receptor subunit TctC